MAFTSGQNMEVSNTATGNSNYTPALISLAVLYFMMGFITCLNDTLVPFFKEGFTLSYSESSLVQFYFFLTYAIVSIPAGKLVEHIGYKNGMVTGFVIAAFGALLFFPASVFHQYSVFLVALFILAIGIVLLQVAANPYITVLGKPETASSRLTLIQGVGSIGTTVAPLFGAHFILSRLTESSSSSDAVSYPYLGIGISLVFIAVILSRLSLPNIQTVVDKRIQDKEARQSIFRFRNLNLGIIALFMYVGAEVAIGTFLTNYIADTLDISEHIANNYVAFYWGGMLVGRLAGSVVLRSVRPSVVLASSAILAATLILISINTSGTLAVWTMILVGLCNSIMFAVIFSLSVNGLGSYTTKASGLLSTAIAGGAVVSYAQGLVKDSNTWQVAFIIPIICYLYVIFYGLNGYKSRFNH
ncbi:sugar MFS transporter [Pseudopedobacter beijingensis]|uniref:Sugar MFS transporter n=1 Tax=Pseudopedobacter beijingensis TaxID=1207056 RepID=A0ABW4ICY4_9SPHI